MTYAHFLNSQFTAMQYLDFLCRILAACAVGAVIGLERSQRFKEAGVRTHILVCFTTALIMIMSKYGFADLPIISEISDIGARSADPARIAAQAVSGISFLCAGVIFKNGNNTIKGLTTAAGIWMTSCLGLMLGAGMYFIAGCGFGVICLIQIITHRLHIGSDAYSEYSITFNVRNDHDFNKALSDQLNIWHAIDVGHDISWQANGTSDYSLLVMRKKELTYEDIVSFVKTRDDVNSFSLSTVRNTKY